MPPSDAPLHAERRRLRRSAWLHTLAVVIFSMLAWSGADLIARQAPALGVPFAIAGAAGSCGALVVVVTILRSCSRPAPLRRAARVAQAAARLSVAVAAVAVTVTGVALAPSGMDRGFVISVSVFLAVLLVAFAVFAGETPRAARPPR